MRNRTLFTFVSSSLFTFFTAGLTVAVYAQQDLPLDHQALFKTHVPHSNSAKGGGGGGGGGKPSSGGGVATFTGTPYTVSATVTPTTTVPEAEEYISVDPNDSSNLLAAVSDFALRGGFNTTKYAFSADNGTSWTENYIPEEYVDALGDSYPATSDSLYWEANSDPVVAIDKLGNVFLADLYFDYFFGSANGLYVSVANLSGGSVTFTVAQTYPVAVNPDETTTVSEDKEWIAVDNSNSSFSNNVYVCWSHFVGNSDGIYFSRSLDHGQTWSAPIQISPVAQNGAVQGSQVAVGPDGSVYVVYEVFFVGSTRQHFLAKSTDGGVTFSTPVAITPQFSELSFNSTYRKNSFASLAVNPVNNVVCAVYSSQASKSAGADVQFIKSKTAGGTSFTAPLRINDVSSGQQFFPSITFDAAGVLHASWFDTRNSGGTTSLYDIYATRSGDTGASFTPNARVTSSLVNAGSASFIGDYAGIAAAGGAAHPVWTNGGFNNGSLQTATLSF